MEIKWRKIEDVKPYAKNAKLHDKTQIANVAESIKQFGWQQPIVIDADGVIIVGHCRYSAAKKLKLKEVPCIVAEDLTEEQVKKYRLLDNKTNESDWDLGLLSDDLEGLDFSGFDVDWGIANEEEEPEVVDDDFEVEVPEEPKAKLGQIYQLGRHRLMCGDSTKQEDVEKLMGGEKADMVFTDPPYALFGNSTGVAGICDDKMTRPFFLEIFKRCVQNTKLFSHVYACCDWHSAFSLQAMAQESGLTAKNMCIWDKGDGGVGAMYQQCFEIVWFFANSPAATKTIGKTKTGERTVNGKPNIWRYNRVSSNRVHNAQKPVEMVSFAIQNSSDEGGKVLDLFGGSGTTLIACEETNRNCYMMELDPKYVDVIIDRWEQFTGEKAVLISE